MIITIYLITNDKRSTETYMFENLKTYNDDIVLHRMVQIQFFFLNINQVKYDKKRYLVVEFVF